MIKHQPNIQALVFLWFSDSKKKIMKKFFLPITVFVLSLTTMIAQGSSSDKGKVKDKSKNEKSVNSQEQRTIAKEKKVTAQQSKKIWEGALNNGNAPKPSINQPVKVWTASTNDNWSQYCGNWTVIFGNLLFRPAALYYANGSAKCFGFHIQTQKRYMAGRHYKIETRNSIDDIFGIRDIVLGKSRYFYFGIDSKLVQYNY